MEDPNKPHSFLDGEITFDAFSQLTAGGLEAIAARRG